jgi:hypothetical protein
MASLPRPSLLARQPYEKLAFGMVNLAAQQQAIQGSR